MNRISVIRRGEHPFKRVQLVAAFVVLLLLNIPAAWALPDSLEISIDIPCQACHVANQWDIIRPSTFDHNQTEFPLAGQHRNTSCIECHSGTSLQAVHQFKNAPSDCSSCHNDPHQGQLGDNCQRCHTERTWQPRSDSFDHNTSRFPLMGAHASVACDACHKSAGRNEFQGLPMDCAGCHISTYQATTAPNHAASGLSTDCLQCHKISAPFWQTSTFEHTLTYTNFELTGVHETTECSSCHAGKTLGTPQDCWSCHEDVYQTSENPPHAIDNFPQDCALCHSTDDWTSSTFDHNQFGFALVGGHAQLTCDNCHADQNFTIQSGQCIACHAEDVVDIPAFSHELAEFGPTCEQCHSVFNWANTNYDHDIQTDYPLLGSHQTATCGGCHETGLFTDLSTDCYPCHQVDFDAAENPEHKNAGFPTNCEECHTTNSWATLVVDHDLTAFPLVGLHETVNCIACHTDGYTGLPLNCAGCHDYATATIWDHVIRNYPTTCDLCHTEFGFDIPSFNHDGINSSCNDCHSYDFDQTTAPNHAASNFSSQCQVCHSNQIWTPSFFDHSATNTGFPLIGAHAALVPDNCTSCHINNQWAGTPHDCFSAQCHVQDYNATTDPNHVEHGYPLNECATCHDAVAFQPSIFQHINTSTPCETCHTIEFNSTSDPDHVEHGYPSESCQMCHNTIDFQQSIFLHANTTATCASCHQYDYNQTTDPNHATEGFSAQCQICHTSAAWNPSIINHELTGFPLTGEHMETECTDCHINSIYSGTPTSCADSQCHLEDFNETTNPNHATQGFRAEDCVLCHSTNGWSPSMFDHSLAAAGFALTGSHVSVECAACHVDYIAPAEVRSCESSGCHITNFNATTTPDHVEYGLRPEDCTICHSSVAWTPSLFSHDGLAITCNSCHTNQIPTTPDHTNFPVTCDVCHSTAAWNPSHFTHSEALTGFALIGQHFDNTFANCTLCHLDNQWSGISHDCFDANCHATQYNETTEPVHSEQIWAASDCQICHTPINWTPGIWSHQDVTTCMPCHTADKANAQDPPHIDFSDACAQCHATNAWSPAAFDHTQAQTGFGLTGAHLNTACEVCHANGYTPPATPRGCADATCHLNDYNTTTNPNHINSGFPTDCESCHTTAQWQGATFDHDAMFFPIYTGKHRNRWDSCAECHPNTSDYAQYTCFGNGCHSVADMNDEHCENNGSNCENCNGFTYPSSNVQSADCLFCHPTGNEDDCDDDLFRGPTFRDLIRPDEQRSE